MADPKLGKEFSERELKRVVMVALLCTQESAEKRPTIVRVVDLLKGELKEDLEVQGLSVGDGSSRVESESQEIEVKEEEKQK